jgi:hypothetical protein
MRKATVRRFGCYGAAAVAAFVYAGCSTEEKPADPYVGRTIESTRSTSEALTPATSLTQMWRTDFTSLKATTGAPSNAYDWVYEQFEPNGEVEKYSNYICNTAGTANGSTGNVVDISSNMWNYCIVSNQGGGDSSVLQIRALQNANGYTSGRLNSKRMHEFAPSANLGLQYEASVKFDANTLNNGSWPAFWMLQRNINEPPVIGDTDNVGWPCLGAQEVDIMEMGSLGGTWNNYYNQSSLHYDTGGCYPQNPTTNPSGNNNHAGQLDDGNYHKYTMEFECPSGSCANSSIMRFFVDGVQESGDINTTGAGYDAIPSFFIINYAIGGGLGGGTLSGYGGNGKSMYVDYVNVASYNPANRGGGGGPPAYRDISQNLATGTSGQQDATSGSPLNWESCTEGGQDLGWIASGSWISWNVNVPAAGNYYLQTRNAVNNGGSPATFDIYVDGTKMTSASAASTGGWQTWATNYSAAFIPGAGNHVLKIVFTSANQNFEWAKLVVSDTCNDGVQDQGETGKDCGGPCPACNGGGTGPLAALGSTLQGNSTATGVINPNSYSTSDLQREAAHVSYWHAGAYIRYDNVNMNNVAGFVFDYATLNAGQNLQVRAGNGCNATTGTLLFDQTMPTTASWTSYTQASLNFANTVNLTTSLCVIAKSSNTMDMANMDWFTLTSGSGSHTGTGPTCSDAIQNQGELGVDCGGPCPACPAGAATLVAVNANTIAGATADGTTGEVLNNGSGSLCWNNVNMSGNTSATVTYGNLQAPNNTVVVTYNGTNLGSAIPIINTDGWTNFTDATTTFAAQSGSGTVCVKVGTYVGSNNVAEVAKLTVGTNPGSGPPPCQPKTCAALGDNCGSVSDGCGGTLSCGSCTSPQTCGGSGTANVCGGSSSCSPTVTAYTAGICNATAVYKGKLYKCLSQAAGVNGGSTTCGSTGVYCGSIAPDDAAWGTTAWSFVQNCP